MKVRDVKIAPHGTGVLSAGEQRAECCLKRAAGLLHRRPDAGWIAEGGGEHEILAGVLGQPAEERVEGLAGVGCIFEGPNDRRQVVQPLEPCTDGLAVVYIQWVEDGKIADQWEVVQPVPASTVGGTTMF